MVESSIIPINRHDNAVTRSIACWVSLFLLLGPGKFNLFAQEPEDAILKRLEAAISTHALAFEKAKNGLLAELEARIKAAAASKDITLQETLTKEAAAFQSSGTLPGSKQTASAVTTYQRGVKAATVELTAAYRKAVSDLTKLEKLDLAESVNREMKQMMERLNADGEKQRAELPEPLETARQEHLKSLERARADLL